MEIRMLKQPDYEEAAKLADQIFRDSKQASMKAGFPDLYSEVAHSFGAFEDGRLVSFMGLLPAAIRIGDASLNVFLLGSVCTHPDYRGKGIAGQILDAIKAHIDEAGASLMLISGTRGLYRRADCHLFGKVIRFTLESKNAGSPGLSNSTDVSIRRAAHKDIPQMAELASSRSVRFEQSVTDLSRLILAEGYAKCVKLRHQVYVTEKNGRLSAFAVAAVPIAGLQPKHTPFIVEWAGDAADLPKLLAHIVKEERLDALTIPVSWHENELLQVLSSLPASEEKNLGTVYVVNANRLLDQLSPYLQQMQGFSRNDWEIEALSETSRLHFAGHSIELQNEQLVSLLFDPGFVPDAAPASLREAAGSLFPIPLPYTGGLNYI